jgi:hypothetical protein
MPTAADRKVLIRLASDLPVGSPERRAVLTGLQKQAAKSDADDWQFLLPNVHGKAFEKAVIDELPSLDSRITMGVEAFAEAVAESWNGSRSGEETLEDLEVWFNELSMALKAIEKWQRNLLASLR